MIVGNHASDAFGRDDNALTLYEASGRTAFERADKLTLARRLIATIAERVKGRATRTVSR
jgi:phosphopantothenoylcysteine decarboxylase/phosphopantothenate--cysteine ligase